MLKTRHTGILIVLNHTECPSVHDASISGVETYVGMIGAVPHTAITCTWLVLYREREFIRSVFSCWVLGPAGSGCASKDNPACFRVLCAKTFPRWSLHPLRFPSGGKRASELFWDTTALHHHAHLLHPTRGDPGLMSVEHEHARVLGRRAAFSPVGKQLCGQPGKLCAVRRACDAWSVAHNNIPANKTCTGAWAVCG